METASDEMKLHPMIVAVEGIDGAGKSTQIPHISAWFERHGFVTCRTCEPTHGEYGVRIRQAAVRLSAARERELFVLDRKQHLSDCMLPALERGEVVITDRYFYSSVAYQGTRLDAFEGAPTERDLEGLQDEIYAEQLGFAPEADVLIYFRLSVDEALSRMRAGRERLDPFEERGNLSRVSAAFERIARRHPCVVTVDAAEPVERVTAAIVGQLESIFREP